MFLYNSSFKKKTMSLQFGVAVIAVAGCAKMILLDNVKY